MLSRLFKQLAPVAALAIGATLAGCGSGNVEINLGDGVNGVPLTELDTTGPVPGEVMVMGPDDVIITKGRSLTINVTGDPKVAELLRFKIEDGTLLIARDSTDDAANGKATIRITIPSLKALVLAGSGSADAAHISGASTVTIAGSGKARIGRIDADTLDTTIAGSGKLEVAEGVAETLNLSVAGSGSADMAALKAGNADVTVAGSGDATFASDGKVDANIMGSGNVTVIGRASCTVTSMGSGSLNCQNAAATTAAATPAPPLPPEELRAPPAPPAAE